MSILPKNEKQPTVDTPRNFFIYGDSMSGKSYLSGEFPNPLFIDTDGNASANPFPNIKARNEIGADGHIKTSVLDTLVETITALEQMVGKTEEELGYPPYETVIIDTIDDIVDMIEAYAIDRESIKDNKKYEVIGDIPYGKGYSFVKSMIAKLAIDLKALPLNVVYISRLMYKEGDNNEQIEVPSLPQKFINIINGNCDYKIQTSKIGKSYLRVAKDKRKNYQKDKIDDERILKILSTVTGAFDRSGQTAKPASDKATKPEAKPKDEASTKPSVHKKPVIK